MYVTRVERLEAVSPGGNGRVRVFAVAIEATFDGPVDPRTGMVANLVDLKAGLRSRVVEPLQGLPLDGREGRPHVESAESLARLAREKLGREVAGCTLARLRLVDEGRWAVELPGEGEEMDVTRVYEFSASHRLHAEGLSADENERVFGKCNNPAGHGHNYVLEVTVRGAPAAGAELLEAARFDRWVEESVVNRWDHRNLNEDLAEFSGVNPTAEEIARVAWKRLEGSLEEEAANARLHRVKLRETARNHVEYYGPGRDQ